MSKAEALDSMYLKVVIDGIVRPKRNFYIKILFRSRVLGFC
jgi:hypothetical protein